MQKEEKLLETGLLYEHLSWLLSRVHAAAEDRKQDTLLIAKRVRRALCAPRAGLH